MSSAPKNTTVHESNEGLEEGLLDDEEVNIDEEFDEVKGLLEFSKHQIFDEICIACLTGDDEDELHKARNKIRESWYRNKAKNPVKETTTSIGEMCLLI
ncbi:conserved hypothetical protein [Ricinus communis]|uniref:Uncharacterized protein n=1 Tax=Ricinus communis TaxID=3988 RepID=B9SXW8_RICCO|nr:conserved hypothetical protein [Ricinus communis]